MRKTGKLSFGERMREWRKARREYADQVKAKLQEKMEIEDRYPKIAPLPEPDTKQSTSPTESTEMKKEAIVLISKPSNPIESAINRLRSKIS